MSQNSKTQEELQKDFQDLLSKQGYSIKIPTTRLEPGSHRALIISIDVEDVKTESGLIIPGRSRMKDKNKNNVAVERRRYFVIKAAEDFMVDTKKEVKLEVGDELFPMIFDGATVIQLPFIQDWSLNGYVFDVIHDSEVMAYKKKTPGSFTPGTPE